MKRIAVLVSGGGTNLQALIDAQIRGELGEGKLALVISSKPGAYALERASAANIPAAVISPKGHTPAGFDAALSARLKAEKIDLVVLAGFLSILSKNTLTAFAGRIINVHPSLIPAFSGPGMYGLKVHEQALARGVKITGATVHQVNEVVDGGEILFQKAVNVQPGDTPETLQRRVMEEAEWVILPKAVAQLCRAKGDG
ncbi:MAG: phosphoribosylglycinamide formyltransferase [Oscillospiraceae bacterium]|nr:phosphoribosylglycinamide formyltransferase [Oscillospiraceae bacterium]